MPKEKEVKHSITLEPYQVVLHPLVTEKGTHISERHNAYTFAVSPLATKHDIKRAVEEMWSVRVVGVRTQNRKGKPRRSRFKLARTSGFKRAVVVLDENSRIELF